MFINRILKQDILDHLQPNKVVVLYGPRQAGKTTLIKDILKHVKEEYLFISGEDRDSSSWIGSQSSTIFKQNIGRKKLLVIDEAQKINEIGLSLKIMVDMLEKIKIIATGSSSFELSNQIGEPLVGRKWSFFLYPIAQMEIAYNENLFETKALLPTRMIYGSYPAVITSASNEEKKEILKTIVDNYLFKDLLEYEGIRKSYKIIQLLRLIAFQIGYEVSLHEIGTQIGLNLRTIENYLDLLEKAFVVKRVFGFSRNLRKEITKNSRFYFIDNGIRNALINSFNPLESRNDVGQLWENYLFIERMKLQEYKHMYANTYFWRTYDQKEVDMIEERGGMLHGYEFKWGNIKGKKPSLWRNTYKNSTYQVINQENYLPFIGVD